MEDDRLISVQDVFDVAEVATGGEIADFDLSQAETAGRRGQIKVGNLAARRDFSDVEDILDAYEAVIFHSDPLPPFCVFNLGSGHVRSIQSILDELIRSAAVAIEPVIDASRIRPVDIASAEGVFDRFRDQFGWVARRNFDETIAQVLADRRAKLRATSDTKTE